MSTTFAANTTKAGVAPGITKPVTAQEVIYQGDLVTDEVGAYIIAKETDILDKYAEGAFISSPFIPLYLETSQILLDSVWYPIIRNGNLVDAIKIVSVDSKMQHVSLNLSGEGIPWRDIGKILIDNPDKKYLFCLLQTAVILISSDNEIIVVKDNEQGVLQFFDSDLHYFDVLDNDYSCISYHSTIGKE